MTERYRGRLSFDSVPVDNDLSLTTPSSRSTSIKDLAPGFKESDDSTGMLFDVSKEQNRSYVSRRVESESLLNQCRLQGGCDPRIDAWNQFVTTLKTSQLDPMSKVEAVNVWINETIRYDYDKRVAVERDWHQTPFTTLSSGRGQCSDIARLKHETLESIGAVADSDMRLVDGLMYDQQDKFLGGHEVLVVNVDGKNWVLNDNFTGTHPQPGRPLLHGGVEQADVFVTGPRGGSAVNSYGRFLPNTADHENHTYSYLYKPNAAETKPSRVIQGGNADNKSVGAVCTTDGNFCLDGDKRNINGTNGELQAVGHQIEYAHRRRISEIRPKPQIPGTPLF